MKPDSQATPARRLADTARRGELHHSLILYGPSATMLRETALEIARALNCLNETLGDDCVACSKIERGTHPDVEITGVADERKMIAVEQIRDLVAHATMRPYEGRYKVFIVEQVDAMSTGGANALLKTLEEPTSNTVFLLLTRSADLLLPTIRSRSQAVHIRPLVASGKKKGGSPQLQALSAAFPSIEPKELKEIAVETVELLASWADQQNGAALLAIASRIGEGEAEQTLALYAFILRDLVSRLPEEMESPEASARVQSKIEKDSLLRSADRAMRAIPRMVVNVDSRLLAEQVVAALVLTQNPG